nr:LEAF RUST 10 DISEASE-RESISTANCE LOCUS RECEPTOR-LIKE PROTEIN KINASE-like 2.4 [Ipomoea batatas]
MSLHSLHSSKLTFYFYVALVLVCLTIPPCCCSGGGDAQLGNCSGLYNCGSLQNIGYPFCDGDRPCDCGSSFALSCESNKYTFMERGSMDYRVLGVDVPLQKMTIVRYDLWDNICPQEGYFPSTGTKIGEFTYADTVRELNIFYGCSSQVESQVQVHSNLTCSIPGVNESRVVFTDSFIQDVRGCEVSIRVPVHSRAYDELWDGKISVQEAVKQGFDVQFSSPMGACTACENSGGRCRTDNEDQLICDCREGSYPAVCPTNNGQRYGMKLALGMSSSIHLHLFFFILRIYYSSSASSPETSSPVRADLDLPVPLRRHHHRTAYHRLLVFQICPSVDFRC